MKVSKQLNTSYMTVTRASGVCSDVFPSLFVSHSTLLPF